MTDKIDKIYEPRISPRSAGFLEEMRQANPAGAELLDRNSAKANIAMAARGMRASSKLTQTELSQRSGLTQAVISRIEAPTGSMPTIETLMKYVEGLGGHLGLLFQGEVSSASTDSEAGANMPVAATASKRPKVKYLGDRSRLPLKLGRKAKRGGCAPAEELPPQEDAPTQEYDPLEIFKDAAEKSSGIDQAIARLV